MSFQTQPLRGSAVVAIICTIAAMKYAHDLVTRNQKKKPDGCHTRKMGSDTNISDQEKRNRTKNAENVSSLLEKHNIFISARFDGAEKERKARELHQALRSDEIGLKNVNMVDASAGEDFSIMTLTGLYNMETMIAFSFEDYGQKTTNMSCSFYELRFAHNEGKNILPIKLCEEWPPKPHDHDGGMVSMAQNRMVFHPGLLYLDWSSKQWDALECAKQVKESIQKRLCQQNSKELGFARDSKGSKVSSGLCQIRKVDLCMLLRPPIAPSSHLSGSINCLSPFQIAHVLLNQSDLPHAKTIIADGNDIAYMEQLRNNLPSINVLVFCAEGLSLVDLQNGDNEFMLADSEIVELLKALKPKVLILVMRYGVASLAVDLANVSGIETVIPIVCDAFGNHDEIYEIYSRALIRATLEFIRDENCTLHYHQLLGSLFKNVKSADVVQNIIGNKHYKPSFSSIGDRRLQVMFGPCSNSLDWNLSCEGPSHWIQNNDLKSLELGLEDLSILRHFEKRIHSSQSRTVAIHFKPQDGIEGKETFQRARALALFLCYVLAENKRHRCFQGIFRVASVKDFEMITSELKQKGSGRALIWIDVHGRIENFGEWMYGFSTNVNLTFFLTQGLYSNKDCAAQTQAIKNDMESYPVTFDKDERSSIPHGPTAKSQVFIRIILKGIDVNHLVDYEMKRKLAIIICCELFREQEKNANLAALRNIKLYRGDNGDINVHFGVTSITELLPIFNLVLFRNGHKKINDALIKSGFSSDKESHLDVENVADILDRAVFQLDTMNERQVEIIQAWNDGSQDAESLRIDGIAGTGKTFIALHCILVKLKIMRAEELILFTTESEVLCFYVAKWLFIRLEKDMNSESKASQLLRNICFLTKNDPDNKFFVKVRTSDAVLRKVKKEFKKDEDIVLFVVDEAHDIFTNNPSSFNKSVQALAAERVRDDRSRVLLLSDESQAVAPVNWSGLEGIDTEILHTSCRATKRLTLASLLYQFRDCNNIDCTHNTVDGPMPKTYIFSKQQGEINVFKTYSETIMIALHHMIKDQFANNLDTHLRIAIAVPDEHFRKTLVELSGGNLERRLIDNGFKSCRAIDAVKKLPKGNKRRPNEPNIILDTISALNGLEFIGVLAVGLDKEMRESDSVAERKLHQSMLYRAISRSRFTLAVINEYIKNGWLTWIAQSVAPKENKMNFDSEKKRVLPQITKGQIITNNNDTTPETSSHKKIVIMQKYFDITSNNVDHSGFTNPQFVPIERLITDFNFYVTVVPKSAVPPAPSDLKMTVLPIGSDLVPVLNWKGLNTIWAYSFIDNRMAFQIVMVDGANNIVKQWYKPGARYIQEVVLDTDAGRASFVGQAGYTVDLTFDEIQDIGS